jgi:cell fate regulator YaaT (PSP1 superfamily)
VRDRRPPGRRGALGARMAETVGVRFKEAGKIYYFKAGDFELDVGNYVVVETSHGREVGRVVVAPDQVIANEIKEPLKEVLRLAEPEDLEKAEERRTKAQENLIRAREKVGDHGLPMRLIAGDYNLEGTQLTLYFTAEERVDFRALVRDLAATIKTRVQLLQVGERDRAKLVDGIGRCGERLCCSSWLTTFPSISIKMAKEQDLPLNPSKISGSCGRLLCCLVYEYDQYREIRGQLPKVGQVVSTPVGEAKVVSINVAKETVSLRLQDRVTTVEMPVFEMRLQYGTAVRPLEMVEKVEAPVHEKEEAGAREELVAVAAESGRSQESAGGGAAGEEGKAQSRRRRRRRGRRGRRDSGGARGGTETHKEGPGG